MTVDGDLLEGAVWSCGHCGEDRRGDPADLRPDSPWVPATVPGTAAGAMLDAGDEVALLRDYDRHEWWFRCSFAGPPEPGTYLLGLDGLATLADVWLNGRHLLRSENMFVSHEVEVSDLRPHNELLLRFSPLGDALSARRPRPRWRTVRTTAQNLRWVRTTLLGRMSGRVATSAPVGPWRPVTLAPRPALRWHRRTLAARPLADGRGVVTLELELEGVGPDAELTVVVGDVVATVGVDTVDGRSSIRTDVELPQVDLWWPHTHGDQPLYDVTLVHDGTQHRVGRVGFRTVSVDRDGGGFTLVVNGVRVFARGTSWMPPDPDRLVPGDERLRRNVELLRDGQHNLVRVPGNTVYESPLFLDLLDELGVMLWQDAMFAYVDVPDDPDFLASATTELSQVLGGLQGRPCVAVVCGGADTEEQAEYQGVALDDVGTRLSSEVLPSLLERLLPGVPYVRSTPGDSRLPTAVDHGVSHYFGVGPYLHGPDDVRRAGVRFATECLPFAVPVQPLGHRETSTWQRGLGPSPDPRHAVHRDSAHVLWDVQDTSDPYTAELFGLDVLRLRQEQPERAETLSAATAVELYERVLSEWRHPGSPCAGALTFYGHDLRLGPGLGLVDVTDRPKATWFAVRRVMQPVAVLVTDEGFSGLAVHVVNDAATHLEARLRVDLHSHGETLLESVDRPVRVPARAGTTLSAAELFPSFRDLTWVHRFGEPSADVVVVSLLDSSDGLLSQAVHLPGGARRPVETDLGLEGSLEVEDDGRWSAVVRTRRLAQWVSFDVSGWIASDGWFHLPPGSERRVVLRPSDVGSSPLPRGRVLAVNSRTSPVLRRVDVDPGAPRQAP